MPIDVGCPPSISPYIDMSDKEIKTVMGPADGPTPDHLDGILLPPYLYPNTDKFKWRKQVASWARLLSVLLEEAINVRKKYLVL